MLKRLLIWVLLPLLAFLTAACGGSEAESSSQAAEESAAQDADANPAQATTPESAASAQTTPTDLAATVNGQPITLTELETEIRIYEISSGTQAADREALIGTVLERLIEYELVEQAAVELGISITDEELATEIAALQAEANAAGVTMEDFFALQGITGAEFPDFVRRSLLYTEVNARITADTPTTATAVRARHILVSDEATAIDIINQLNAGADFPTLASQYSLDPSTRDFGGDLGWVKPGDLIQQEVEAAIFSLPPNSRATQPIRSVLGYHVIEVLGQQPNVALDEEGMARQRILYWQSWLSDRRTAATIVRYVGPNADNQNAE